MTHRGSRDADADVADARLDLARVLDQEWVPALGCTEPASIACAAAHAAHAAGAEPGTVKAVHLVCDARLYKNCHAVGIPRSGRRAGILWALAIGANLPDASAGLECFRGITPEVLAGAQALIHAGAVTVDVDPRRTELHADCRVVTARGVGRAVVAGDHTNLAQLERDGAPLLPPRPAAAAVEGPSLRGLLSRLSLVEMTELAAGCTAADATRLLDGAELNLAMARHGLALLPAPYCDTSGVDAITRTSRLVCAGVIARMSGEDLPVMSLAGSGNKGITASVPLLVWGRESGFPEERIARALALSCVVTAAVTPRLGRLSAVCGVSNAAGVGLATAFVALQGGDLDALDRAVNNVVGNVAGMICDGAKVGCGLKATTAVDAAFRAASLALAGMGIPATDGIVGSDAGGSLDHLERIAGPGMQSMDVEILHILQAKLR